MKIWFDTEFCEGGKTIELISIEMVREDGATYHAEVFDAVEIASKNEWLKSNVRPHLIGMNNNKKIIAKETIKFAGDKPEFWAYYADYDWVVLCQLYGRMIDLPALWPMFCMDVKQFAAMEGNPRLPKQFGIEHHALADALHTKLMWKFLMHRKVYGDD